MFKKHPINFLLLSAFIIGLHITAMKIAIARILTPYFGNSIPFSITILGIIMLSLSIGYYIGGRIADKHTDENFFYKLLLGTGIYTASIPFLIFPIVKLALLATTTYAITPMVCALICIVIVVGLLFIFLGALIPYAIRLQFQQSQELHSTVSYILSCTSLGNIVGILISTFITIPTIGTSRSILLLGVLLMSISILRLKKWMLLTVPITTSFLTLFTLLFPIKPEKGLLFETESAYNYIQVIDEENIRMLRLSEGFAEHSVYEKGKYVFRGEWDYFLFVGLLNPGKEVLSIGLAGGTTARQFAHFMPGTKMDGIEIDPVIASVGKRYFGLNDIPNLHIIIQDARLHLRTTSKCYDNICIDAYKQPYIPFHLTTQEFFKEIKQHLNYKGIVSINVGSTYPNSSILLIIQNTMRSVFKHVYSVRVKGSFNYLVWATDYDFDIYSITTQPEQEELNPILSYIQSTAKKIAFDPKQIIFTDNIAPTELYTEKMILDFAKEWRK